MNGWISIHRSILNHWVWQDEKCFRWWMCILLSVNHSEVKFPVGYEIHTCAPGESFKSIEEWSRLFRSSKKTTLKFFNLLENDGMIHRKTIGRGNRRKHLLTVNNWNKYQQKGTERKSETTPEGNPTLPPNNYDNKGNKIKRKTFIPPPLEEFIQYFLDNGFDENLARRAYKGYEEADWRDSTGKPIRNWKQKCQHVWFKQENKNGKSQQEVSEPATGLQK